MPPIYIIGVEAKSIRVSYRVAGIRHRHSNFTTLEGMRRFFAAQVKRYRIPVERLIILGSSSLDFPKEYTKDRKVLAMVRKINKGRLS